MAKLQKTNSYICKNFHVELQQKMTCVCCNRHMQKHLCEIYNKLDYDFTNFVVWQCLQHVSNSVHDYQYICSSCDKILKETSDENPVVPHYARYANVVTGANFLKALNQRPEYVCTCCHRMLFCKTVQLFHMEDYDISNETVKASLLQRYVMKLHKHTPDENDDMTTHISGHNLYQMMWNRMTYMLWMNIFVYGAKIVCDKKIQKCLIRHVQMVYNCMTSHKIYKIYCCWREE